MRERQVVAVLELELGGARDAGQADQRAGSGRGGKGAQHGAAGDFGHASALRIACVDLIVDASLTCHDRIDMMGVTTVNFD